MNFDTKLLQVQDVDKIFEYKNNKRKVSYGEKIDKIEYGKITKCFKKDKSLYEIFKSYNNSHLYYDKLIIIRYNNNLIIKNQKDTVINP